MPLFFPRYSSPVAPLLSAVLFVVCLAVAWSECNYFFRSQTTTGTIIATRRHLHTVDIDYTFSDGPNLQRATDTVPPIWQIPSTNLLTIEYIPNTNHSRIANHPDKLWSILASLFLLTSIVSAIAAYRRAFSPRRSPYYK